MDEQEFQRLKTQYKNMGNAWKIEIAKAVVKKIQFKLETGNKQG